MANQVWDRNGMPVNAPDIVVQNDLNQAPMLDAVPPAYSLAIVIPSADNSQLRLGKIPGDVFLAETQARIAAINAILVLKVISANVTATYTATVALLAAATKPVTVTVSGIIKDELVLAQPKLLPAGWGYQGAIATADNTVTFSLAVPPLSVNGTGTCTFAVYAQRKLVS